MLIFFCFHLNTFPAKPIHHYFFISSFEVMYNSFRQILSGSNLFDIFCIPPLFEPNIPLPTTKLFRNPCFPVLVLFIHFSLFCLHASEKGLRFRHHEMKITQDVFLQNFVFHLLSFAEILSVTLQVIMATRAGLSLFSFFKYGENSLGLTKNVTKVSLKI